MTGCGGKALVYDGAGNLTSYDGKTFAWKNGRQLREASVSGGTVAAYTYDHEGKRASKTVGGVKHTYIYGGDILMCEKATGLEMKFSYDSVGNPVAVMYNGTEYYYVMNLQGDIIGLVNAAGAWVVEYRYDVWGNIQSISGSLAGTLGADNPLRYRGYYYDTETGLYYISCRYYNPEIGRFISPDTIDVLDVQSDLYDKNLYSYCDNNPVMRADYSGKGWITVGIMAVGGVIGGVIGAVGSAVTQNTLTGTVNWKSVAVAGVAGFVSGAVAASPLGIGWQEGIGAGIGAASYVADCRVNKKSVAVDELIVATAGGFVSGVIGGSGANQHLALTRTIQTSIKTTTRMSTRACTRYAAKQIASTKAWTNNILTVNAMGSSARFAAGTGCSNALAGAWTTVKGWFSKLFK